MLRSVRHIWDTHLQSEGGLLAARAAHGPEIYFTATFAQVTIDPPRIAVNPNRIYPIEAAILGSGKFAINVMPASARDAVLRVMALRRRERDKPGAAGLTVVDGPHGLPTVEGAIRTLYCEVESHHDTGDHTVIVGRLLEVRFGTG